jgi:hypothetical protein
MRPYAFSALVLLCATAALAQEVPTATTRVEPKQKALRIWTNEDLQNLNGAVNVIGATGEPSSSESSSGKTAAKSNCASDAWASTVGSVLKLQGVTYGAGFWSERLFGGACIDKVTLAAVASRIDGDYTLDDGRRLHLKTSAAAGLPSAAQIVASMDNGRPLILQWKGKPLVVTKVDYIDRQYDYVSMYTISSLMLTDVLTGRLLIFDMKTNSDKEIEGSFQVSVNQR